jgi:hypothetical protein
MKKYLLIAFLALSLPVQMRASSVIAVEIATTDSGMSYAINKGNSLEAMPATLGDIETWLRVASKDFAGPILLYADDRTAFSTVMDMLRLFKTTGVKAFAVVMVEKVSGVGIVQHSLSGTTDKLRSQ